MDWTLSCSKRTFCVCMCVCVCQEIWPIQHVWIFSSTTTVRIHRKSVYTIMEYATPSTDRCETEVKRAEHSWGYCSCCHGRLLPTTRGYCKQIQLPNENTHTGRATTEVYRIVSAKMEALIPHTVIRNKSSLFCSVIGLFDAFWKQQHSFSIVGNSTILLYEVPLYACV